MGLVLNHSRMPPDEYQKTLFKKAVLHTTKSLLIRGESTSQETEQAVSQISVTMKESHTVGLASRMLQACFWGQLSFYSGSLGVLLKRK